MHIRFLERHKCCAPFAVVYLKYLWNHVLYDSTCPAPHTPQPQAQRLLIKQYDANRPIMAAILRMTQLLFGARALVIVICRCVLLNVIVVIVIGISFALVIIVVPF